MITAQEREYLFDTMAGLLEEYDYTYNRDALEAIIDEWAHQKSPLIDAFKKHPNYVEGKFMITFSQDYERTVDGCAVRYFSHWLRSKAIEEMWETLPADINQRRKDENCAYLPDDLYRFLCNLDDYAARTISKETAERLTEIIPEVRVHVGQKTSRVVNKICKYLNYDKHPDYNREYAKYADALSPMTIKRHTVLSINPMDYLTMSFGNSWSSCHTIDKENKRGMPNGYEGQYSSGTISYMLDPSSMVFYTIDAAYDGNEFWNMPKINRQMFHFGEDKLVQGRLYPQDEECNRPYIDSYRIVVQEILSTIFDFPNLWSLTRGTGYIEDVVIDHGTHYQDYRHYDNCTLSYIKGKFNDRNLQIGSHPICIECGGRHKKAKNINCCTNKSYQCTRCGCCVSRSEMWIVNGEVYCADCANS